MTRQKAQTLYSWRSLATISVAFIVLLGVAALRIAHAGAGAGAPAQHITETRLLDLNKKYQDASVAADTAALEPLLADDMIFVHGNAVVDTKASYLDSLRTGHLKVTSYESGEPKMAFFDGGAVVSAISTVSLASPDGGPPRSLTMRISSVWVSKPAGWQMIFTQGTPLQTPKPGEPGAH
jgi:ketosteroid isomerase-like protein